MLSFNRMFRFGHGGRSNVLRSDLDQDFDELGDTPYTTVQERALPREAM